MLFGNPGVAGTSWVVRTGAVALVWPLVLLAVFVPLSVRAIREVGELNADFEPAEPPRARRLVLDGQRLSLVDGVPRC